MSSIKDINPQKGMRDILPKQVELRNFVSGSILAVYKKYGFLQIETPSLEDINLLSNGEGGENEKMLFKVLKRGEKLDLSEKQDENSLADMGLRYDLTVPLCRFYANNKAQLPQTFKVIQFGDVWRAERPQKGRFRQFKQCDIDIIGVKDVSAEAELILATSEALLSIGFKDFKIKINDRRILSGLVKYCGFEESDYNKVFIILDKLVKIGIDGVKQELQESNFSVDSVNKIIEIIKKIPETKITTATIKNIITDIDENILKDLDFVIDNVSKQAGEKYSIVLDISLVRGMGYYTGQIFEIEAVNYGTSIAGGGRYDNLVGRFLDGVAIPACGFSIGFERVISILEEQNFQIPKTQNKIVLLYSEEDIKNMEDVFKTAQKLRESGNTVLTELKSKNLKAQLDKVMEQGFDSFAIFSKDKEVEIKSLSQK